MKIIFDKTLETGVFWQDKQHKELLDRISALSEATDGQLEKKEVARLLDFLDEYVVVHFNDEERAMHESGFPDTLSHLEKHIVFIEELARVEAELGKGISAKLAEEVRVKVAEWFMNHICVMDKKLGAFLIKKSGGQAS
ncbi:MAG: hemerythrin family protein [Thermodesulfobacteriota bacterium]